MKVVKSTKEALTEPLVIIINQMLKTGIFPDKLKIAKVNSTYKKMIKQYSQTIDQYLYYLPYLKYSRG